MSAAGFRPFKAAGETGKARGESKGCRPPDKTIRGSPGWRR